ncbi:hypothetical protein SeseC_02009 [Streptococcus equi subsp. zooepidemicus ATCC 35246]|nr:hypothetical protein SeseC_02009 [Streptococcus equi subsp. zooepidemicus ATCC 35246]
MRRADDCLLGSGQGDCQAIPDVLTELVASSDLASQTA